MGIIADIAGATNPVGQVVDLAEAASNIIGHFFPDKTQQEKDSLTLELQGMMNQQNLTMAQLQVDNTEAGSTDKMQHWRGALGWVCVFAFAWQFVCQPFLTYFMSLSFKYYNIALPPLPVLDTAPLMALCVGMLGLGTMHTVQLIKGVGQ